MKVTELFKEKAKFIRRIDDKDDIFLITRFHCETNKEGGFIEILGGNMIYNHKEFEYSVDGEIWNLLERSDNSDYAVPPAASPKVCPNCESKNYHEETCEKCNIVHCYCDDCGQTFA